MLRAGSVISAAVLLIARPAFADSLIDLGRGDITIHVPASYDPGTPVPYIPSTIGVTALHAGITGRPRTLGTWLRLPR